MVGRQAVRNYRRLARKVRQITLIRTTANCSTCSWLGSAVSDSPLLPEFAILLMAFGALWCALARDGFWCLCLKLLRCLGQA